MVRLDVDRFKVQLADDFSILVKQRVVADPAIPNRWAFLANIDNFDMEILEVRKYGERLASVLSLRGAGHQRQAGTTADTTAEDEEARP